MYGSRAVRRSNEEAALARISPRICRATAAAIVLTETGREHAVKINAAEAHKRKRVGELDLRDLRSRCVTYDLRKDGSTKNLDLREDPRENTEEREKEATGACIRRNNLYQGFGATMPIGLGDGSGSDVTNTDWLFDFLLSVFKSPEWDLAVMGFIDQNCAVFDTEEENKLSYTTLHHQFKELVSFKWYKRRVVGAGLPCAIWIFLATKNVTK